MCYCIKFVIVGAKKPSYKAQKYFKEVVSTTLLFDLFRIIDFGIKVFATTTFFQYTTTTYIRRT
jgi:hypothetical protein